MTEQEIRRYLRQMAEDSGEQSFRGFYDLTYDRLFRIACHYLRRPEWAQEVVLDVFVRLWELRKRLPMVQDIEDYCFILPRNAALNYLSREERYRSVSADISSFPADGSSGSLPSASAASCPAASVASSPEEILISEELFARYVKALDRLPSRCREVFLRLREQGQSYEEAASEMGISRNTVDAHLQEALRRLRRALF